MHPFVAASIVAQIENDRRHTARHARAIRHRHRRAVVRRVLSR
jgi:hypothetical protein